MFVKKLNEDGVTWSVIEVADEEAKNYLNPVQEGDTAWMEASQEEFDARDVVNEAVEEDFVAPVDAAEELVEAPVEEVASEAVVEDESAKNAEITKAHELAQREERGF